MTKDPAFLFYPGDYLRDTQNLGEKTQVAYDRIMCEHMRNICVSKQQLKFFTKRLSGDEIEELMLMLTEINGGFQIEWVAESINKRKAYSDSRRKNRSSKKIKDIKDTSSTYDSHMEDEDGIENSNRDLREEGIPKGRDSFFTFWQHYHDQTKKPKEDLDACLKLWEELADREKDKALSKVETYAATKTNPRYLKKCRNYLADKAFNNEMENPEGFTIEQMNNKVMNEGFGEKIWAQYESRKVKGVMMWFKKK